MQFIPILNPFDHDGDGDDHFPLNGRRILYMYQRTVSDIVLKNAECDVLVVLQVILDVFNLNFYIHVEFNTSETGPRPNGRLDSSSLLL